MPFFQLPSFKNLSHIWLLFFIYITHQFQFSWFLLGKNLSPICLFLPTLPKLSSPSPLLIQTPASFINKSPCLSIPSWNIYIRTARLMRLCHFQLLNMHFSSLSRHSRLFLLWLQPIFQIFLLTNFWHKIGNEGNTTYWTTECHVFSRNLTDTAVFQYPQRISSRTSTRY